MAVGPEHESRHVPVLAREVLNLLAIEAGQTVVDATVGMGGHAAKIAQRLGPSGRLVAMDRDPSSLEAAQSVVHGCRVDWVHSDFRHLRAVLDDLHIETVDRVFVDLGVASPQLDRPERGFSFRRDGPLDMRMDPTQGASAANLIAQLPERDLAWIFWEYGEERFSRPVARKIAEVRCRQPIRTTTQLAELVRSVVPRRREGHRRAGVSIDPATRVFQALRIAVNDEMGALEELLRTLPSCVAAGGRVAIISFHSLEDRRVKHAFRDKAVWQVLTKSPVIADEPEYLDNPRSRSAKLRAARRVGAATENAQSA